MVKKKVTKPRTKDARLATARRVAREAAKKSRTGVLSLIGVKRPKDIKADVWVHDGDSVFVVRGWSKRGKNWIAKVADHSEGFEGSPIFGVGAYAVQRPMMAPILRGMLEAGLTVSP